MIEFEITRDNEFIKRFLDKRDVARLSPEMVWKLRDCDDPYGRYGYGKWLYAVNWDEESMKKAYECFRYAADNGIADALQMISNMHYYGEGVPLDRELSNSLNLEAISKGSELARLSRNFFLFYGRDFIAEDKQAAISEAEQEACKPGASPMWREQLGWYQEEEERYDEAVASYERCLDMGLYYPIFDMSCIFYNRGNIAYVESLLEEGIEKDVPDCMMCYMTDEDEYDALSEQQKSEMHDRLAHYLPIGAEEGSWRCCYLLAMYYLNGSMGFPEDRFEALRYAYKGVALKNTNCCALIVNDLIELIGEEEKLRLLLWGLRHGDEDLRNRVSFHRNEYVKMGLAEEMDFWCPIRPLERVVKTEIPPTVMIIQPSGFVDFVEEDVYSMSFREMAALIDAEGLDAVHFSEPLNEITKACKLDRQLTMYVDRNAIAKGLPDNAVGTMLYGGAWEIRGAVIIAMEDHRYDTYSFDLEEHIEAVYDKIDELSGGLLTRDWGQEDGRFDAWS